MTQIMSAGKGLPLDVLISFIASVGFGLTALYVAIARRHEPTWAAGVILLCACAEITMAHTLQQSSSDQETRIFWYKMVYMGFTVTPTAFLCLALRFSGLGHVLTNRTRLLLSIFPVLTGGLILTNEIHGLVWNPVNTASYATSSEFLAAGDAGIWYWAFITYSYLALGAGCFFLIRLLIRSHRIYEWQTSIVIGAAVLAILGSMLDIFKVSPLPPFSTTALGLAVGSIMVAFILSPLRRRDLLVATRATVFNTISDAIIVVDVDERIIDLNLAAEKLVGRPASRALSRPLEHLLPALTTLLTHDASTNTEVALYHGKTQSIYDLRFSAIQGWQGHVVGQVIVLRDITERKLAEESLRASEERFAKSFHANPIAICVSAFPDGRMVEVNEAFLRLIAYKREEVIGRSGPELDLWNDPMVRSSIIRELLERGSVRGIEGQLRTKSGHLRDILASAENIQLDGQPHALIMLSDITERKQAEEQIRQLNAELELRVEERTRELHDAQEQLVRQEKLAVLGQLAGGVGHELRNPLGVISTSIYYLKLVQPEADEKIKQHHAMIEQEVHNADKIITDLLDFARVVSVDREPVSVPDLVQRVLGRFPVPALVEVALKLPASLPMVFADPPQMVQVLGNLTVNACQAMGDGGKLTILAHKQEGMVAIAVKDTGTGISPENMKKLFEPLFTTKVKGIGLGLVVSRKLAEANGGRIEVKSEPGKGSTFTLVLPVGSK